MKIFEEHFDRSEKNDIAWSKKKILVDLFQKENFFKKFFFQKTRQN